jgi:hypothetical protein
MRFKLSKPRFILKSLMIAVACCALALWAAPRIWDHVRVLWHTPSVFDVGWYSSELHAWPGAGKRGSLPGIDEGSCLRDRTGFVIWTDFRWSPASRGGHANGTLTREEANLEHEVLRGDWKAGGGKTGMLVINDEPYLLDKGCLFLVSTQDGNVRLKQLDPDLPALMDLPSDRFVESLQALAKRDRAIAGFFLDAAKRKYALAKNVA